MRFVSSGIRSKARTIGRFKKWAARWGIGTEHFDPHCRPPKGRSPRQIPLDEVLVENSTYNRFNLKRRLYDAGLWNRAVSCAARTSSGMVGGCRSILDHINGVSNDNRLENLRIVCPNCAATLDTHCGRKNLRIATRVCPGCGEEFIPRNIRHRYCSLKCWGAVTCDVAPRRARPGAP